MRIPRIQLFCGFTFLLLLPFVTLAAGQSRGTRSPNFQVQQVDYLINNGQFDMPSVVTADFNHDGKLDLAVSNASNSTVGYVSVLLGNGDGTFQVPLNATVGTDCRAMVAADFNHDGNPDLAVTNEADGTVSILLGNGDGTFQTQLVYSVGFDPIHLATGDFNGDGKLDIVLTVSNSDNKIAVLLGNGDGTFQSPIYTDEPNGPYAIVTGDFNKDGKLDVAVADFCCGSVSVLLGKGDGSFKAPTVYALSYAYPNDIVAADFNGDGNLDLAVSDNSLTIFLGKGNGEFAPGVDYGSNLTLQGLNLGDFNKDGKLDVVGAENGFHLASLFFGNGDGTFQNPTSFGSFFQADWMAIGDFNHDGLLDLVVTDNPGNADLLLQGTGTYAPIARVSPTHLTFRVKVGHRNRQGVTLSNTGNAPLDISRITFAGNRFGVFHEKNTCGPALYPNTQCLIHVSFHPLAQRRYTATLVISDNAANSPQQVPLVGVGQ